jgi:hypothetical protein
MTVEYIVLGVILILMGVGQIYFRHFGGDSGPEGAGRRQAPSRRGQTGGRIWQGWTAILGFLGVAMGIALLVLGVLGY